MMRFWERAFRRAQLAVATSNGFHPHLRFTLASPLPVGVTSEAELMEVYLETPVAPESCQEVLSAQSVPSITIKSVTEMPLTLPSLQARMRFSVTFSRLSESLPSALVAAQLRLLYAPSDTPPWRPKKPCFRPTMPSRLAA